MVCYSVVHCLSHYVCISIHFLILLHLLPIFVLWIKRKGGVQYDLKLAHYPGNLAVPSYIPQSIKLVPSALHAAMSGSQYSSSSRKGRIPTALMIFQTVSSCWMWKIW